MRILLGNLTTGEPVYDRPNSHLHEGVAGLLPEALMQIRTEGRQMIAEEVDLGRFIGITTGVETTLEDEIIFAQRVGRKGLTRFVKNREGTPTSFLTVVLQKNQSEESYTCLTAWVGRKAEPEPWDRRATEQSVAYWRSHALLWGSEPVVQGTETIESSSYYGNTAAKPRKGYVAVVLSEGSVEKLRQAFPPTHVTEYYHHLTVVFQPSTEQMAQYESLLGSFVTLTVVGHAHDERGQAVRVKCDLPVANIHPHITLSCSEGVKPVYSNQLLERGWEEVDGIILEGELTFIPFK